jgi:hypothetical protein
MPGDWWQAFPRRPTANQIREAIATGPPSYVDGAGVLRHHTYYFLVAPDGSTQELWHRSDGPVSRDHWNRWPEQWQNRSTQDLIDVLPHADAVGAFDPHTKDLATSIRKVLTARRHIGLDVPEFDAE